MRRQLATTAALMLLAAPAWAADEKPLTEAEVEKRDGAVWKALDTLKPQVAFDKTPLRDAVAQVSKLWGVRIEADWAALEKETAIRADRAITLRLRDLTLEELLLEMLEQGTGPVEALERVSFKIWSGGLRLLPMTEVHRVHAEARRYDLAPFLTKVKSPDERRRLAQHALRFAMSVDPGVFGEGSPYSASLDGESIVVRVNDVHHARVRALFQALRDPKQLPPEGTGSRLRHEKNVRARAALKQRLNGLQIRNLPLEAAVKAVADKAGMKSFVNVTALRDAGVDVKAPLTVVLKQPTGRAALQAILDAVPKASADELNLRPAFIIDAGFVIVSTAELLSLRTATVVYDVSDLAKTEADSAELEKKVRALDPTGFAKDLLDVGDQPGAVATWPGRLYVRQTRIVHDKIETLFEELRAAQAQKK